MFVLDLVNEFNKINYGFISVIIKKQIEMLRNEQIMSVLISEFLKGNKNERNLLH